MKQLRSFYALLVKIDTIEDAIDVRASNETKVTNDFIVCRSKVSNVLQVSRLTVVLVTRMIEWSH